MQVYESIDAVNAVRSKSTCLAEIQVCRAIVAAMNSQGQSGCVICRLNVGPGRDADALNRWAGQFIHSANLSLVITRIDDENLRLNGRWPLVKEKPATITHQVIESPTYYSSSHVSPRDTQSHTGPSAIDLLVLNSIVTPRTFDETETTRREASYGSGYQSHSYSDPSPSSDYSSSSSDSSSPSWSD